MQKYYKLYLIKMNPTFIFLSFVLLTINVFKLEGAVTEKQVISGYSTKYDNFDVKKILSSERLVQRYVDCLMDRVPCPSEGKFLKDIIPDAIATKCSKCNEAQRKQAALIIHDLLLKHREKFFELCSKYDPTGEARKAYGIDESEEEEEEDEE